jgi:superfamily II DNA/RNA helicase
MIQPFKEYGLCSPLLKAIEALGFKSPTKVQSALIPLLLEKKDSIVLAQTGSGKTAAFAIPVCELLDWEQNKPQALVITPTRELALQVKEDIFHIGRFKRIKTVTLYGKSPFGIQAKALKQKTHVVVGTPGRILDHIEKHTLDLSEVKMLVIDEADELFNMGFIKQLEAITAKLPKNRINTLLSATMPKDVQALCEKNLNNPTLIQIEEAKGSLERISQLLYKVEEHNKALCLKEVFIEWNPDSCIIFCNTREQVDILQEHLAKEQIPCYKIHGAMEQDERQSVMNRFRLGHFRYLIATDVAARGIDIESISLVVNYDIPREEESYVHRIGRTGRIGKEGVAITFMTSKEHKFLEAIQNLTKQELILKKQVGIDFQKEQAFYEKIALKPLQKEEKGAAMNAQILKLHINAGKKTKMRPVDIVGTLCNLEGMSQEDIGIIEVLDVSTFVEILNNKGEHVFKLLQTTPIKGRIRRVSKADPPL